MKKSNIYIYAITTGFLAIILIVLFINIYLNIKNQIKIGLILPLTGAGKNSGNDLLKGIQLAADETNKWGGINNRKIKLIIKDSESKPDKVVQLFYEIEIKYKPLLYMTSLSTVSLKLSEEAEKNKVVLCCLSTAVPEITHNKEYTYRYWPMANDEVAPLYKIFEKINIKNIGLLYLNDIYGNSIKNDILKVNTEYEFLYQPYDSTESNFDKITEKAINEKAICIIGYDTHEILIINNLLKNNYKGMIIGNNTIITAFLREGFKLNNFYGTSPLIYNENYQFNRRIKEIYKKRFNLEFNHFTGNGYDMCQIVFELLKDKNINRTALEEYFNNGFVHTGVFGIVVVRKGMHDFSFDLYPVKVENGKILYDW